MIKCYDCGKEITGRIRTYREQGTQMRYYMCEPCFKKRDLNE